MICFTLSNESTTGSAEKSVEYHWIMSAVLENMPPAPDSEPGANSDVRVAESMYAAWLSLS